MDFDILSAFEYVATHILCIMIDEIGDNRSSRRKFLTFRHEFDLLQVLGIL